MNDPVDTKRCDQPVLFLPVGKVEGGVILAEEFARVRIEGHRRRGKSLRPRGVNGGRNHLRMPAMDTVEIADGGNKCLPVQRRLTDRPVDGLAFVLLARIHGAALYRATCPNINARTRFISPQPEVPGGVARTDELPLCCRQRLAAAGAMSILITASRPVHDPGRAVWHRCRHLLLRQHRVTA